MCLNALDTRVVLPDGRTAAPLKFRLFRQNFFDWPKGDRTCLCDDFQIKGRNVSKYGKGMTRATLANQRTMVFLNFYLFRKSQLF